MSIVVAPSMRARIQDAADQRGNMPYAYIVRQAIQAWLDTQEPKSPAEIRKLTDAYLASKTKQKNEDGHA